MGTAGTGDRAPKIAVAVFTLVIAVAMLGTRACMRAREARTEVAATVKSAASARANTKAGPDKTCRLTTEPSGATVYEVIGEESVALGVSPLNVEQGDYAVRVELSGHQSGTLPVGVHQGPCTLRHAFEAE